MWYGARCDWLWWNKPDAAHWIVIQNYNFQRIWDIYWFVRSFVHVLHIFKRQKYDEEMLYILTSLCFVFVILSIENCFNHIQYNLKSSNCIILCVCVCFFNFLSNFPDYLIKFKSSFQCDHSKVKNNSTGFQNINDLAYFDKKKYNQIFQSFAYLFVKQILPFIWIECKMFSSQKRSSIQAMLN